MQEFRSETLLKKYSNTGVFLWILGNFYKHLFCKTSTNSFFYKLQKLLQNCRKTNWHYCLLWTDFTTCPSVFMVGFEQVSPSWEAKRGINYRICLNASKSLYWKQSKWDQQNFLLIFSLKLYLLFCFIFLLIILNQKSTVSKETIGFDVWMATILSHIKPRSTTAITKICYSIPRHFSWFTNDPEELKLLLLN